MIVARSTGTAGLSRRSGTGSSSAMYRRISCLSEPDTAGSKLKNSYRVAPSA